LLVFVIAGFVSIVSDMRVLCFALV